MADDPKPLTEEEYRRWLTPAQAQQLVGKATGDWNGSAQTILRRADSGKIRVHAEDIEWKQAGRSGALPKYSGVPGIILRLWETSNHGSHYAFWNNGGDDESETRTGHTLSDPNIKWRLFGIRFDPEGIAKLSGIPDVTHLAAPPTISTAVASAAPPLPIKHAGGAPTKVDWEAVMVEISARLFLGDLQPKKQTDLEAAITEVVMSLFKEPIGEATARRHASPLWKRIKTGS